MLLPREFVAYLSRQIVKRLSPATIETHTPEMLATESARQAVLQQTAIDAPAGTFPVVLAAGDSGILLHEAVGHGLRGMNERVDALGGTLVAGPRPEGGWRVHALLPLVV